MKEPGAYGDLTKLNRTREILDTIGRETLDRVARSYLDLLDTSAAIYEADGSYASAFFTSSYCRLLDRASRRLCATDDDEEALKSGRWLCHKSCWTEASRRSIETGKPYDLRPCAGGINIYSVPVKAGDRVIGSMNFGYGTPPTDEMTISGLAERFEIDRDELLKAAREYVPRPDYVVEAAKRHLELAAEIIGEIYQRRKTEVELKEKNNELERMNDIMVSRELEMIRLKERIKELEKRC